MSEFFIKYMNNKTKDSVCMWMCERDKDRKRQKHKQHCCSLGGWISTFSLYMIMDHHVILIGKKKYMYVITIPQVLLSLLSLPPLLSVLHCSDQCNVPCWLLPVGYQRGCGSAEVGEGDQSLFLCNNCVQTPSSQLLLGSSNYHFLEGDQG